MRHSLKQSMQLAITLVIVGLLSLPFPALAQGSEQPQAPEGIGIMLLMMGLAAIVIVGGIYISQNRSGKQNGGGVEHEE
jgi:hypothetical protein